MKALLQGVTDVPLHTIRLRGVPIVSQGIAVFSPYDWSS